MAIDKLIEQLQGSISKEAGIYLPHDKEYPELLERWSNLDLKRPGAIVLPANEEDVALAVREASAANVPFVAASGGHSPWSSTDANGIVIDLKRFKDIVVDAAKHIVKVSGGVLTKDFQVALSAEGQFTAVANGNTVGVIPYFIGGGISSYTPLIGYGCENILAARIVVATGEVVETTEAHEPDLLWAIRGAGQFFGVVTELTLRTYDLEKIGPGGTRHLGTIVFPVEQAGEVTRTLAEIVNRREHVSAGHMMIVMDPTGSGQRIVLVAPQFYGSEADYLATFKPLDDLKPAMHQHLRGTFETHSDHLAWMLTPGEFKSFSQTGVRTLDAKHSGQLAELHGQLLQAAPDAARTGVSYEWHTPTPTEGPREVDTSFGNKDIEHWLNVLAWYTDASHHEAVFEADRRCQEIVRQDTKPEAYVAYTNTSRDDPIDYRYKDMEAVKKLQALKQKWDPHGRFTTTFL